MGSEMCIRDSTMDQVRLYWMEKLARQIVDPPVRVEDPLSTMLAVMSTASMLPPKRGRFLLQTLQYRYGLRDLSRST